MVALAGAFVSRTATRVAVLAREIMPFVSYFPGRGTVRETAYLEGKTEGKAGGWAEGGAKGILFVLEARGVPVSDSRERAHHRLR